MSYIIAVYGHYGCCTANGGRKKEEIKRERQTSETGIRESNNGKLNGDTCHSAGIPN